MKHGFWVSWMLVVASQATAHRLDEYLQATRIGVSTNRIEISIDLTPGIAIADRLWAKIDRNGDGQLSEEETVAYTGRVLKDVRVRLDEETLTLSLSHASFPDFHAVQGGLGVIRIKTTAPVETLKAGKHVLDITNGHLPAMSVYLVNALIPECKTIEITKQTRDRLQKHHRMEFWVSTPPRSRQARSTNSTLEQRHSTEETRKRTRNPRP